MSSVNKVILVGNLGRDPEVRYAASGTAIANFSIATTRVWKDKASGKRQEETEWHRVVAYERTAEVASEYLKTGRSVYVEGRLKTRKWQDKSGADRYTTEIIVDQLVLLGGREDGAAQKTEGRPSPTRSPAPVPVPARAASPPAQARPATGFDDMDDDVPF